MLNTMTILVDVVFALLNILPLNKNEETVAQGLKYVSNLLTHNFLCWMFILCDRYIFD